MNTQVRLLAPEKLDNLSLSGKPLTDTLHSLKLINIVFGNHRQLANAVLAYCKSNPSVKEFRIVDLGCGGGDSINFVYKKLKKHNITSFFVGIDGNANSISHAVKNNSNTAQINFTVANILDPDFQVPECDLLISSHFIYHFDNEDFTKFLKKVKSEKIKHLIFSELYRSGISYYLFKTIRAILPISEIAKKDGLHAIQRAFSVLELKEIIRNSGIEKFQIRKKPFFRIITKIDL